MSVSSQWVFDRARNEYYYFSPAENAYVYRSGFRLYLTAYSAEADRPSSSTNKSIQFQSKTSRGPYFDGSEENHEASDSALKFIGVPQTEPQQDVTDPDLFRYGLRARGRLRGTWKPRNDQYRGVFTRSGE
jgi:hypothetical protein